MAVVRINFVKKGTQERKGAKANIKYIENRRGKEGEKMRRTLFTGSGQVTRQQAYEMVHMAEEGSTFFRVKICPDPVKEDSNQDLLLREITAKTMDIEEKLGKPVTWVAAIHDDHTDKRHVHVLVVAKTGLLPAKVMIQNASAAALEQRRELDQAREHAKERGLPSRDATANRGKELSWERQRSR